MDEAALAELIRGAQRGDAASFDRLVEAFAGRIYGFVYRLTGRRHDAEDLMQEVFVRVVRTIGAYQHEGRFEAWLFRIAANLVRDRVRRSGRGPRQILASDQSQASSGRSFEPDPLDTVPGATELADARLIRGEQIDAMNAALALLPAAEREVIMLRHFSGMSFREIAEVTGTPLGTALARAHRGLGKLRELMEAMERREDRARAPGGVASEGSVS